MAVERASEPDAQWYVVHAYSGHEEKVKKNLEKRIESMDMQDKILQVLVPMEDEIEIKDGKRRHVQKRIFPGYILVRMVMSNESWFVVRNTPGVTSFVGSANSPVPLQEKEVRAIQKQMKQEAPKIRVEFQVGESVRVVDGPFTDFHGKVDEINPEKGKLKVLVNMFGRETPVELDLLQVEKVHCGRDGEEEGWRSAQDRAACGHGDAGAAGRHRARSARGEHHGVLPELQRALPPAGRRRP